MIHYKICFVQIIILYIAVNIIWRKSNGPEQNIFLV